ncbi:hypothetical protein B0O95_104233 [Mycetohabitans endofungorum]|uniref:Uncharacterized protein n=1 Tax=Mycetohabitans endofungorum TaxID=417203 RepID=A0A2P5KC37_9BURK|nr:hypothetical protein B0O95_104233 [Mycetohabitans endofungorum]
MDTLRAGAREVRCPSNQSRWPSTLLPCEMLSCSREYKACLTGAFVTAEAKLSSSLSVDTPIIRDHRRYRYGWV